jgi:hypothetical protein
MAEVVLFQDASYLIHTWSASQYENLEYCSANLFYRVELKTTSLESFRVSRFDPNCVFVGVPFLKKGSLPATMWSSSIARMLIATDLPQLQFLSLFFTSEVC